MGDELEQPSFRLDRFGWSSPDRLELMGRWSGMKPRALREPVMVAHGADGQLELEALPNSVRCRAAGRWSASFAWRHDAAAVDRMELLLTDDLVVDLPQPNGRRFGRVLLPVRAARSRAPGHDGHGVPDADEGDGSPLDALEAALVEARRGLEEAWIDARCAREETALIRHELEAAREETALARDQVEREHERRRRGAERPSENLLEAHAQAQKELARAHESAEDLKAQFQEATSALSLERAARSRASEDLRALRVEFEAVREGERAHAERLAEEVRHHREAMGTARQIAQRHRDEARAAADDARRAREEVRRLRLRVEERDRLTRHLATARADCLRRDEEIDRLRRKLEESRSEAEKSRAVAEAAMTHAEALSLELAMRARRAARGSGARASATQPPLTRVLVVAAGKATTPALLNAVRERATRSPCRFALLVPNTTHGLDRLINPDDHDTVQAEVTLRLGLPLLEEAAGAPVDGLIGVPEPLDAVHDAMNLHGFDEIIVFNMPRRMIRWLQLDLSHKLTGLGIPVTHVCANGQQRVDAAALEASMSGVQTAAQEIASDLRPAALDHPRDPGHATVTSSTTSGARRDRRGELLEATVGA